MVSVVSINRAGPGTVVFNNKEVPTGIFKQPVAGGVEISEAGVVGDTIVDTRVHGGSDQAVYLYHKEDYDWWAEQIGRPIDYGTFGENLTVAGLDEINWVIGDRLRINDVVLEITAPRTPCFKLGVRMNDPTFVKKFARANRPGAYARVLVPGSINTGDSIEISKTANDYAAVKEVFALWHSRDKSPQLMKQILASPIAEMHKAKVQGWYDQLE